MVDNLAISGQSSYYIEVAPAISAHVSFKPSFPVSSMRAPQEQDSPLELNVTPMLDVVFSILTFFIMSTLFLTRSEGLPVNLPQAATAKSQQQTRIAVTVQPDGQVALNKVPIQLAQLETGVRTLVTANQQPVVVIHADTKVEHGQLISVMDEIRKIEGVKMAIATKKK